MVDEKVLLIRPNGGGSMLPNGILYISAYLEKNGYNTIVKDLTFEDIDNHTWGSIRRGVIAIAGISMLSDKRKQAYGLIKEIRKTNKDIKIVIGGLHATALSKLLVDNLQIDAAVVGEGEITMKELADFWIRGMGNLKDIKGIATRKHGVHEPRELIENLDDLPFPNYDKINLDWYYSVMARNRPDVIVNGVRISEAKYVNIISSRGCSGRCKFCACFVHWKFKTRFRSAENILKEMKYLYDKKGIRLFQIADDAFGQDQQIVIDLCKGIIKMGMKIAWHTDTRVDCVTEKMLIWMKKSGCFCIAYGVESGSEEILEKMGKGITVDQIKNAIALTKKVGIKAYALLMKGNLSETTETIEESIRLMNEVEPDIHSTVGYVMVCPGTVYYEIMKKRGQVDDSYWLKEEDGLPTFLDGFTEEDMRRWFMMLSNRVPQKW